MENQMENNQEDYEEVCEDGCTWVYRHTNWYQCSVCKSVQAKIIN